MDEQLASFQSFNQLPPDAQVQEGFEEEEAEQAHHPSEDDFYLSSDLEALLDKRHVVEFGFPSGKAVLELEGTTRPQPSFNRRFDWLISDLKEKEQAGYQVFIFA